MNSFLRSKNFWFIAVPLILIVVAYATWQLASTPGSSIEGSVKGTVSPKDESTPPVAKNSGSTGTTADGIDDFGACNDDAKIYCDGLYTKNWQEYATANGYTTASWKYSLLDCLEAHKDQTAQACDDSLERRQVLNDALNTACNNNRATYCAGVEPIPGSEPQVDCLKANYEKLSTECAAALDAHEAAKQVENN